MSVRQEIAGSWRARLAAAGVDQLDPWLIASPTDSCAAGRWTALSKPGLGGRERWQWDTPDEPAATIFVKRYARPSLREQWDRCLRQAAWRGRAAWEYARAVELAEASIAAPRPVAYIDQTSGCFERCGVVCLERAVGAPLDRLWLQLEAARAAQTLGLARHEFAVRLGRFVAAFHGTGLCHRDLYLCHIFADVDPAGLRPPHFSVIDLARTFRPRVWRMRWLVKDLAQLDSAARQVGASRADRFRFLLAYLGLERRAPRARVYGRAIARKSDWIIRRSLRKGRRIVPPIGGL